MAIKSFSQLDKRQQTMVLFGAPGLLVLLFAWLSWGVLKQLGPDPAVPTMVQRPGGIWSEIEATNLQIAEKQKVIDELPAIEKEIASLENEIKVAEERLPLEAEKPEVRALIERMAREIPTTLGTVQYKAVKINEGQIAKGQDYQTIIYQTEVAGDLNGIIKYIDSIEKNTRFMAVRNLTIKPGAVSWDKDAGRVVTQLHTVNMDIVTYVYNASQKKKAK